MDAYLTDSILWARHSSDRWGTKTAATITPVRCRHEIGSTLVTPYQGQQVQASGSVLMREQPSHSDTFRIDGAEHPIIKIEQKRQGTTVLGWKVWYK